jgi:hypothetical protein
MVAQVSVAVRAALAADELRASCPAIEDARLSRAKRHPPGTSSRHDENGERLRTERLRATGRVPGHVTVDELSYDDGKWVWTGERIRTTSEFGDDGKVQRSFHEQSNDGARIAADGGDGARP